MDLKKRERNERGEDKKGWRRWEEFIGGKKIGNNMRIEGKKKNEWLKIGGKVRRIRIEM